MANGPGWDAGGSLPLNRYRELMFGWCYLKIHGFLRDEALVQDGLARLGNATNGMDQARFRTYLAEQEQRFGFARELGVINKEDSLLKASRFWLLLMQRQALVDIGAGDAGGHGVLTHRVQWVLIGQWHERANELETRIATLYQNLAAANARLLTHKAGQKMAAGAKLDTGATGYRVFHSLWDDLVDSEERNATSPEHLFAYIKAGYPALHDRMRW